MSVLKIFRPHLQTKLHELWHKGYTEISKHDLMLWFNRDQVNIIAWRGIKEEWEEYCGEDSDPPTIMQVKIDDFSPSLSLIRQDMIKDYPQT